MPISTIFTALFYPYIAHERTAQNLILSVCSVRSTLCLKEHHRSQNESLLKSEERLSDFKENCAQLWRERIWENKLVPSSGNQSLTRIKCGHLQDSK